MWRMSDVLTSLRVSHPLSMWRSSDHRIVSSLPKRMLSKMTYDVSLASPMAMSGSSVSMLTFDVPAVTTMALKGSSMMMMQR